MKPFWHCNNPETDLNVWKVIAWQPLPEPYKEQNDADIKHPTNEEMCEWTSTGISDEWKQSCDPKSTYNVFGVAWFKYCPYCGKRMKVVQHD